MKKILLFITLCWSGYVSGQLSVNILTPPGGMMDKQQLWNIIATNTESTPLLIQVQVAFTEVTTGQPVFTASISSLMISPGTTQLTPGNVGTVLFNIVNPDYQMDPGPNGLLPVGTFNACYTFLIDKYNKVVRECQQINIPPLGPLLLTQPVNGAASETLNPLFSWLPYTAGKSFGNLRYDLRIVEVLPEQTAADAVKDNLPLFNSSSLAAPNYPYTNNTTPLEPGKQYAWQVIALNNQTLITKSEIWSFRTKDNTAAGVLPKPDPVFIKLTKTGAENGDVVFWGNLRFDFFNESANKGWNILIDDLTSAGRVSFTLPMDSIIIKRGQNLVNYDAAADRRFVNKHLYLLRVVNARNESWQLRFEYRSPGK